MDFGCDYRQQPVMLNKRKRNLGQQGPENIARIKRISPCTNKKKEKEKDDRGSN